MKIVVHSRSGRTIATLTVDSDVSDLWVFQEIRSSRSTWADQLDTSDSRHHAYIFTVVQETIFSLKKKLHAERQKLYVERQRLTLHPKAGETRGQVLEDDKKVSDYGLKDGDSVLFKDLGPQVWERGRK